MDGWVESAFVQEGLSRGLVTHHGPSGRGAQQLPVVFRHSHACEVPLRGGRSGARALAVTPMGTQMAQWLSDRCGHSDGFSDGYSDGSLPPLMGWSGVNAQMGIQMGRGLFLRFPGVHATEPLRWGELPRWGEERDVSIPCGSVFIYNR